MENASLLNVTVVYALPQELFQEALELPPGSRVRDALAQSGVLEAFPDIDIESAPLGMFSRRVELGTQSCGAGGMPAATQMDEPRVCKGR